ncbi:hypothetical protein TBLA_0H02520 [Henningerozyma blattae CBS 6284]|uniref:Uncharacterized protein n=1 Tax=Henningerozyma blattae (strain ATCC 34711 / CBS 6284 / DSM 70876 / NBRC 10599 / NRRL Y-10934 / UCD 77-7) TaxID=1071380 RepID=I2H834_HENB6|nr:hypothetical protein TBLA_0H02520 [Tetrapisispora blattae CBS 6284]CCH62536.1 hypothetical protein TBLA_0H02520 [Tetrapisispora blattae CBS 6284]
MDNSQRAGDHKRRNQKSSLAVPNYTNINNDSSNEDTTSEEDENEEDEDDNEDDNDNDNDQNNDNDNDNDNYSIDSIDVEQQSNSQVDIEDFQFSDDESEEDNLDNIQLNTEISHEIEIYKNYKAEMRHKYRLLQKKNKRLEKSLEKIKLQKLEISKELKSLKTNYVSINKLVQSRDKEMQLLEKKYNQLFQENKVTNSVLSKLQETANVSNLQVRALKRIATPVLTLENFTRTVNDSESLLYWIRNELGMIINDQTIHDDICIGIMSVCNKSSEFVLTFLFAYAVCKYRLFLGVMHASYKNKNDGSTRFLSCLFCHKLQYEMVVKDGVVKLVSKRTSEEVVNSTHTCSAQDLVKVTLLKNKAKSSSYRHDEISLKNNLDSLIECFKNDGLALLTYQRATNARDMGLSSISRALVLITAHAVLNIHKDSLAEKQQMIRDIVAKIIIESLGLTEKYQEMSAIEPTYFPDLEGFKHKFTESLKRSIDNVVKKVDVNIASFDNMMGP